MVTMKGNFRKEELLRILEENRGKHRAVFEDALDGYREECVTILGATIEEIRQGKTPQLRIMLVRPEDHTRDYDRIIKMLQLDTSELFELDERQFGQYVMDEWDWSGQWKRTMSSYAPGTTMSNYGEIGDDD